MIAVPFFSTWHAPFLEAALGGAPKGFTVLASLDEEAVRAGLETVNNDACYTALLAAGRTVEALRRARAAEGGASFERVVVPVTCALCRGDDAPYLVGRALAAAGVGAEGGDEGVCALGVDEALADAAAGDGGIVERLADAVAVGDALLQARLRVRPYLDAPAAERFDRLLAAQRASACAALGSERRSLDALLDALAGALARFGVPARDGRPVVGVVGALPAVFDERMNAGLAASIEREGCEAALPYLAPLAVCALRAREAAAPLRAALENRCAVLRRRGAVGIPCPTPHDLERAGTGVVPRHLVQGAGWTIAGCARLFVEAGVRDLAYVRAFGCLAGHVVGQGALKPLRAACAAEGRPANLATIEFDPGTSEVNQVNRIKLMTTVAKRAAERRRNNL